VPPLPDPTETIDAHVHLVGMDRDATGCFLADRMRNRVSTRWILRKVGAKRGDAPRDIDRRCVDHLREQADLSPSVDRLVLLALDGVSDPVGNPDDSRTGMRIPNDYAFEVAAGHPKFLVGCSINPLRRDALPELDRCAARGAVLVKWIPAAMGFDPADPRCASFLDRLAELGMPLLSHVGTEMAVATVSGGNGGFDRLLPALERGVTVILPHAGGRRLLGDEADFRRLVDALKRHPRLHLDDSALTMFHRRRRLMRLIEEEELHDRVLHGSDYPLPVQAWAFVDRVGVRAARSIASLPGCFERDLVLKRALGAPDRFLGNAHRVLRLGAL